MIRVTTIAQGARRPAQGTLRKSGALQITLYIDPETLDVVRRAFMSEHETVSAKLRYLIDLGLMHHKEATGVRIRPRRTRAQAPGRKGEP